MLGERCLLLERCHLEAFRYSKKPTFGAGILCTLERMAVFAEVLECF